MVIYVHTALSNAEKERIETKVDKAQVVFAQDLPKEDQQESFLRAEVAFGNVSAA